MEFEHFDQGVADAFTCVNESQPGLPRFLGLRIDRIEADRHVVRVDVGNEGRPVAAAQGTVLIQEPKPSG